MTEHGSTITRIALPIFKASRERLVARFAEYEADARADHAAGYRTHYCVHGTNNWTDYDNICGGCEDGLTSVEDYMPIMRADALAKARQYRADMEALTEALMILARLNVGDHADVGAMLDVIHERAGVPKH